MAICSHFSKAHFEQIRTTFEYSYMFVDASLEKNFYSQSLGYFLSMTILLGFIVLFIGTLPEYKIQPSSCPNPVCYNVTSVCPGKMVCEPVRARALDVIESIVIYVFTAEYTVRFFTCWAVSRRKLGIYPRHLDKDEACNFRDLPEHYIRYVFSFLNFVDLATILPYYFGEGTAYLRSFRLLKLFKLLRRLKVTNIIAQMILDSFDRVKVMMVVWMYLTSGIWILYGSVLFSLEKGTFQATPDHPHGFYFRHDVRGKKWEMSPFQSIPTAFYFLSYTLTGTGNDFAVTTVWGRAVASSAMLFGCMWVVFPLVVVYVDVVHEVGLENGKNWDKAQAAMEEQLQNMTEDDMIEMFESAVVENGTSAMTEYQFKELLTKLGVKINKGWLTLMLQADDCNNDGLISEDEFIALMYKLQGNYDEYERQQEALVEAFIMESLLSDEERALESLRRQSEKSQRRAAQKQSRKPLGALEPQLPSPESPETLSLQSLAMKGSKSKQQLLVKTRSLKRASRIRSRSSSSTGNAIEVLSPGPPNPPNPPSPGGVTVQTEAISTVSIRQDGAREADAKYLVQAVNQLVAGAEDLLKLLGDIESECEVNDEANAYEMESRQINSDFDTHTRAQYGMKDGSAVEAPAASASHLVTGHTKVQQLHQQSTVSQMGAVSSLTETTPRLAALQYSTTLLHVAGGGESDAIHTRQSRQSDDVHSSLDVKDDRERGRGGGGEDMMDAAIQLGNVQRVQPRHRHRSPPRIAPMPAVFTLDLGELIGEEASSNRWDDVGGEVRK